MGLKFCQQSRVWVIYVEKNKIFGFVVTAFDILIYYFYPALFTVIRRSQILNISEIHFTKKHFTFNMRWFKLLNWEKRSFLLIYNFSHLTRKKKLNNPGKWRYLFGPKMWQIVLILITWEPEIYGLQRRQWNKN